MARSMLRNSERSSFKTCRFRWSLTWNARRQTENAPNALRFGDLIHRSLAPYYKPGRKRGPHPAKTFEQLYHSEADRLRDGGFDVYADDTWVKALDLGVNMMENYVLKFKDKDAEYEVISSEQTFQTRLIVPALWVPTPGLVGKRNGEGIWIPKFTIWMVGTFDGVWRHLPSRKVSFKEFKTCSSISTDGAATDEQASTYWTYGPRWLMKKGIIAEDEWPRSILYTWLRKQLALDWTDDGKPIGPSGKPVQPIFRREPIYRDEADRRNQHEAILAEARDIWLARQGSPLISLYKNHGPLHMPNCRGCSVRDACEVHEAGGAWKSVYNSSMVNWEPYAAHELPERV